MGTCMLKKVELKPYQNSLPNLEAISFFEKFLEKEYEVTLASVSDEIDAERFMNEVKELDSYYREGLKSGVLRIRQPGDFNFEEKKLELQIKACRTCFLLRSYQHKEYGIVYRFYTGTDRTKGKTYYHSYYVAKLGEKYQIIAVYLINERHNGWERRQGVNWEKETIEFTGVWRIVEPYNDTDLEDYRSEQGIDHKEPILVKREEGNNRKFDADTQNMFSTLNADMLNNDANDSILVEDVRSNSILSCVLPLLGGRFYTNGFIRNIMGSLEGILPEEQGGKALKFADLLSEILNADGCGALNSVEDFGYFPFVYYGEILLDGLPDFAAKDDVPNGAKVIYDTVEERRICFWYDEMEEDVLECFEGGKENHSYQAYLEVDKLMRENLTDLVEFQVEKGIEFPYVIGGTFAPKIFVGVITKIVRT